MSFNCTSHPTLARLEDYKETNGKTTQRFEIVDKMKLTISSCRLVDLIDWNAKYAYRLK